MQFPSERIIELTHKCEHLLELYIAGSGGHREGEPWYGIIAAGLDFLSSIAIAAVTTTEEGDAEAKTVNADLSSFLSRLLGERDPALPPYIQVFRYPPK